MWQSASATTQRAPAEAAARARLALARRAAAPPRAQLLRAAAHSTFTTRVMGLRDTAGKCELKLLASRTKRVAYGSMRTLSAMACSRGL